MEKVIDLIIKSGFSIHEISLRSGIPMRTIQNWIYNGVAAPFDKAEKVLEAIGFRIEIIEK